MWLGGVPIPAHGNDGLVDHLAPRFRYVSSVRHGCQRADLLGWHGQVRSSWGRAGIAYLAGVPLAAGLPVQSVPCGSLAVEPPVPPRRLRSVP